MESLAMPFHMIDFREEVRTSDREDVRSIIESSGFFYSDEVSVAVELVEENLAKGNGSGYFFLFAEQSGSVVGYSCFGPVACTRASYDLYWIAVHESLRGRGLGKELMQRTERSIAEYGGERVYVETSSRDRYEPTRIFYMNCGYKQEAVLKDFYAAGDDKIIYAKVLG